MSLKKVQQDVDKWTNQFTPQYWPPMEQLAQLTEEVGEIARELSHRFGTKKKKATEEKAELSAELADVIFALVCIANSNGIDLDKAWQENESKRYSRDVDRFKKK